MGTSTDAILFYGFSFEDDDAPEWIEEGEETWEEKYAIAHGVNPENHKKAWDIANQSPCELNYHCYIDYPMYLIAIKKTKITANRGGPEEISEKHFKTEKSWDKEIRDFCKILGVTPPEKFGWYLVSYWG